ncbi:ribosome maturation factor RimP [Rapidithrix thailandica]|uniref:Ribosome maturation factor RimP n=1 Tax=Rapidithrix thailandica TaxID=413964 RepID=A0AAW9S9A8_9BACT
MSLENTIIELIEKHLPDDSLFLVDMQIKPTPRGKKILVTIDGDKGVTINQCAELSRKVGFELEEGDIMKSAYNLEISSPGIDQPLQLTRQYHSNVGRKVEVLLTDGQKKTGTLTAVNELGIDLDEEVKEKKKKKVEIVPVQILFENIDKTKVLISFK